MDMFDLVIQFVTWVIKHVDVFLIVVGLLSLLITGFTPISLIGLLWVAVGGFLLARRKGWIGKK